MSAPDDYLECPHCGGAAIWSESGTFGDGDGTKCDECGFPGTVSVDDADEDDVSAYWNASDDPLDRCERADCEECKEMGAESTIEPQVTP